MRGKVAKRLRKKATEIARNSPTEYKVKWTKIFTKEKDKDGNKLTVNRGTILSTGYRKIYQDLKKEHYGG